MKRVLIIGAAVAAAVLLVVLLAKDNEKIEPVEFTEGGVAVRVQLLSGVGQDDRLRVTLNPEAFEGRIAAPARVEVSGGLTPTGPMKEPRTKPPVYAVSTVHLEIPVHRPSDKPGKATVKVSYQACAKGVCLPAVTDKTVTLTLP